MMKEILDAREERSQLLREFVNKFPVVIIKANLPGLDKNPKLAYFLVDLFRREVGRTLKIHRDAFHEGPDGPWWLLEAEGGPDEIKTQLVDIEDFHGLGRLIDLDVFDTNLIGLSRRDLGLLSRSCLLCELPAHFCVRNQTHSLEELISKINWMVNDYLRQEITGAVEQAMTEEIKLEPKFGLVTETSSGSHHDMDSRLMELSKKALLGPFTEMFFAGYNATEFAPAFENAKALGIKAEAKMFAVTKGINTYKGLIFIMGTVLFSLGRCFWENDFSLFSRISKIGQIFLSDLTKLTNPTTAGEWAYQRYGISGIKGETAGGMPNVRKVMPMLDEFTRVELHRALICLIGSVDDTVLLKRCGEREKYEEVRKLIGGLDPNNLTELAAVTDKCVSEQLSFGGSADLLIIALFLRKIEKKFNFQFS